MTTKGLTWKRRQSATSITIDPDRVHEFFRRRRLLLSEVSRLLGRSRSWLSAAMAKRRMNYYVIDEIAVELGLSTEDVLYSLAADEERELMEEPRS